MNFFPETNSSHQENNELRTSFLGIEGPRKPQYQERGIKKILFLGLTDVGKTSLAFKFLYGFSDVSGQTSDENHFTFIKWKNRDILLHIVDVADIDEYTPLYCSKYSTKVDAYIFVYSITCRKSFNFVQQVRDKLYDLSHQYLPAVIVANKSDLRDSRKVSTSEGKKLAKLFKVPFFEVSAIQHSSHTVEKIFERIMREIMKNQDQIENLKFLKHWEEKKVNQLYNLLVFTTLLTLIIGAFFVAFGLIFILSSCDFSVEKQGVLLLVMILDGLITLTFSVLNFFAFQREETELMKTISLLLIMGALIDVSCLCLSFMDPWARSAESKKISSSEKLKETSLLLTSVFSIHLILVVFLFFGSILSQELFIKRKSTSNKRFASLEA